MSNPEPQTTLLTYLRNELNLCGTKLGCGEGGCGACTVMVSYLDILTEKIQHISVNACLAPVCSMHGMAVTTVEGKLFLGCSMKFDPSLLQIADVLNGCSHDEKMKQPCVKTIL